MGNKYDYAEGFGFLIFGLFWFCFLVFWLANNYWKNSRYLKPLRKFMNFILFCKCIECFCMMGYILNQSGDQYWIIAVTSMITIYKTFIVKLYCVFSQVSYASLDKVKSTLENTCIASKLFTIVHLMEAHAENNRRIQRYFLSLKETYSTLNFNSSVQWK